MCYHYYILGLLLYFFIPTSAHNVTPQDKTLSQTQDSIKTNEETTRRLTKDMDDVKYRLKVLEDKINQTNKEIAKLNTDIQRQR
jgi:peptidoglycan hydrolase CwlO-like protein